ncbi:MAG: ABC transporter permease [Defluviitaleaceae bacterium]|nr:ABC transporter permease [Defluviitaleaceae bacterium]
MQFFKYLGGRLLSWFIVIYVGVTLMFFIPRFFPADPVEAMVQQMLINQALTPQEIDSIRQTLNAQFGLEGTLWEQYVSFLQNVIRLDFGPSLSAFPAPATDLVLRVLPYTVGLTLFTLLVSWTLGNLIGMVAGFRKEHTSSKILEWIGIVLYPIPFFIMALVVQIVFCFILGWFPITADIVIGAGAAEFWGSLIRASILPAGTMILLGLGWWIISMKAMAQNTAEEDFVRYARFRGIPEGRIGTKYVFRNSIIPQVSALSIALGGIFGGAIMVEIIFQYPGVGRLVFTAIQRADYNLIMATATISIFAVSTATLIADLIYPFIDPRIKYR